MLSRRHDSSSLIGNVILHASVRVDGKLGSFIDWTTKATVILAGIDIVCVVFGVVNVVFGTVTAKTVGRDFEFAGTVTESEETEDTKQKTDSFGRNRLDSAYIDSLRIIAKPVAEVDTRDHDLTELLAMHGLSHGKREQGIFDVAMAP